jgi:hypothetical protein
MERGSVSERTRGALRKRTWDVPTVLRTSLVALALGSPLLGSTPAEAQEWLKDRMYSEGAGIRTGDVEWHPGIAAEGGYDSNYFLRTDKTGPNLINGAPAFPVQGSPVMRITPSLSLSTIGAQRKEGEQNSEAPTVNFRLGASGTYREFFGQLSPEQRNFSADVNAKLDILPGRPVGGALFASYDRVIQPNAAQSVGNADLAFNRDALTAGAEISVQPGSGTLDFHVGNSFTDTIFEQTAGQPYASFLDTFYLKGRWKFRPRTALIYDGTFGISHFDNTGAASAIAQQAITGLNDSYPIRTRLGINGLITPRFSLLALVGYGGSFFTPAAPAVPVAIAKGSITQQYDSVIGQAELKFYLAARPGLETGPPSLTLSSLAVGYTRDFMPSFLASYYGSDRGYLRFSYFFAGRALISLEGGAGAVEYPTMFYPNGQPMIFNGTNAAGQGFTDERIDATLFGEYRFTNYFGVNLTAKYTTELSNVVLQINPTKAQAQEYAMEWQHLELYAGVRFFL